LPPSAKDGFWLYKKKLQEKAMKTTNQKEARRKKPHMPKPEEHECMPQHQQCPLQSVGKMRTQSTMKRSKMTLREPRRTSPQKRRKETSEERRTKCCMRTFRSDASPMNAREATNYQQNCQAINQAT
jgi:hypothetical protein